MKSQLYIVLGLSLLLPFPRANAQVNQHIVQVLSSKHVGKKSVLIQCDGGTPMVYEKYVSGVVERVVLSDCVKEIEVSVWKTEVRKGDQKISLDTSQRYLTNDWVNLVVTESTGAMRLW